MQQWFRGRADHDLADPAIGRRTEYQQIPTQILAGLRQRGRHRPAGDLMKSGLDFGVFSGQVAACAIQRGLPCSSAQATNSASTFAIDGVDQCWGTTVTTAMAPCDPMRPAGLPDPARPAHPCPAGSRR